MPDLPPELLQVITSGEASYMWGVSSKNIIVAIHTGRLQGRKSKGTWIITLASLVALWGKPNKPMIDWEVL